MPIYGFTSRIEFTEIADAAAGFINQLGIETSVIKIAYSNIRPKLGGKEQIRHPQSSGVGLTFGSPMTG